MSRNIIDNAAHDGANNSKDGMAPPTVLNGVITTLALHCPLLTLMSGELLHWLDPSDQRPLHSPFFPCTNQTPRLFPRPVSIPFRRTFPIIQTKARGKSTAGGNSSSSRANTNQKTSHATKKTISNCLNPPPQHSPLHSGFLLYSFV